MMIIVEIGTTFTLTFAENLSIEIYFDLNKTNEGNVANKQRDDRDREQRHHSKLIN